MTRLTLSNLNAIADPRSLLQGLFENSPVAFVVYRADGSCLLVNPAYRELFGAEPPPDYNVLRDDAMSSRGYLERIQRAFAGETVHIPPHWYSPREWVPREARPGRRLAIAMVMFPLRGPAGEIEHVALTFRDATAELERHEERERLKALLDWSADILVVHRLDATSSSVSSSVQRILGWSEEELLAGGLELVHPDDRERAAPGALRGTPQQPVQTEYRMRHRDGSWRWMEVTAVDLLDHPAVRGVVVHHHDVTALKAALDDRARGERELRAANDRLQILADTSRKLSASHADPRRLLELIAGRLGELLGDACAVMLVSPDGGWLELTSALVHRDPSMIEVVREVMIALPHRVGEGPVGEVAATGEALLVPTVARAELVAATSPRLGELADKLEIASLLVAPLKLAERILGVIVLTRGRGRDPYGPDDLRLTEDLADRASLALENARLMADLEQRVSRRTAALEEANRELASFSYSISHDLRAPLRGIDGFSRALLEEYDALLDAQGRHYLSRVLAGVGRMSALIDDLLQLSKVTRLELHMTPVDLSELARDVLHELRAREPDRHVGVSVADGLNAWADARLMTIVLENLLGNAWKFTSRRPEATIEVGRVPGGDAFYVKDNGAGFDMAYADKLFLSFHRLHRESEFEGTGIGLATVQRIITRHGGRIWAEAAIDRGATFYFELRRPD